MSDLEELLSEARELAPKLGAAADRLNEKIREVEAALVKLHLGVPVEILIENSPQHGSTHLAFIKMDRTWGLFWIHRKWMHQKGDIDDE